MLYTSGSCSFSLTMSCFTQADVKMQHPTFPIQSSIDIKVIIFQFWDIIKRLQLYEFLVTVMHNVRVFIQLSCQRERWSKAISNCTLYHWSPFSVIYLSIGINFDFPVCIPFAEIQDFIVTHLYLTVALKNGGREKFFVVVRVHVYVHLVGGMIWSLYQIGECWIQSISCAQIHFLRFSVFSSLYLIC